MLCVHPFAAIVRREREALRSSLVQPADICDEQTTDHAASAAQAVFDIPELLEAILVCDLDFHQLFTLQRVCVRFKKVMQSSVKLQRAMFLRAQLNQLSYGQLNNRCIDGLSPLLRPGSRLAFREFEATVDVVQLLNLSSPSDVRIRMKLVPKDRYTPARWLASWWQTLIVTKSVNVEMVFDTELERDNVRRLNRRDREAWRHLGKERRLYDVKGTFADLETRLSKIVKGERRHQHW